MVANHLLSKGADIVIFRLVQGLASGLDVDLSRGIGDMGNLGIGGLCRLISRNSGLANRRVPDRAPDGLVRTTFLSLSAKRAACAKRFTRLEPFDAKWGKEVPGA